MDNEHGKPERIEDERTGRKTVRIAPLTNSQLVYGGGDEDLGMENLREVLADERFERGGVR